MSVLLRSRRTCWAGALRLVAGEITRPTDDGRRPHAVHDVNVVGVVGVKLFEVAEWPGAERFADGVVDPLLVGEHNGGRGIRRSVVFFLFLLRGGGGSQREAEQKEEREE